MSANQYLALDVKQKKKSLLIRYSAEVSYFFNLLFTVLIAFFP